MRISGQPFISPVESRTLKQVTTTKRGDKRGTDVNIIGFSDDDAGVANSTPNFSASLSPGVTDFDVFAAVPADISRKLTSGVFCSTVYWKVEIIVDGTTEHVFMGVPFTTVTHNFKSLVLAAGQVLQIKYTNLSSLATQVGSIYATLEFADTDV